MAGKRIKTKYPGVYKYRGKLGTAFHVNYRVNGKLNWESVGWEHDGVTAEDARDRRAQLVSRARHSKQASNMSFKAAFERYIQLQMADNKDVTADLSRYNNHLRQSFGSMKIRDIRARDILLEKAQWDLAESTKYQVISLISNIYAKLIKYENYTGRNPVKNLDRKTPDNKRVRFLTKDEAKCFLKVVLGCDSEAYYQVCLALFGGLRKVEVMRLRGSDINFDDMVITVHGKGDKYRQVEMAEQLADILYNLKDRDQLFTVYKDKAIRKAIKKCGLNPQGTEIRNSVSFHTLRHTFASWLVQQGTPLYTVKDLMGHATIRMTERYAHLAPKHRKSEVNRMVDRFLE